MKCDVCGEEIPHQEHCGTPKMVLEVMDTALQIAKERNLHVVTSDCVKEAFHRLYCPKGQMKL